MFEVMKFELRTDYICVLEWFLELMIKLEFMRFQVRTDNIYASIFFEFNDSRTVDVWLKK